MDLYDHDKVIEMCLVLNVIAPKKFCVPEFIKYTITHCPATYLISYCNKMVEVVLDKKMLIHSFMIARVKQL